MDHLLRDHAQVALRQQPPELQTQYLQFVGWYFDDQDPSRIIPQFFPFHPVWLAIGLELGGIWGALLITPLWGVLGLAAVYFYTSRLFNPIAGLVAATLLALTPTHLYFTRYPTAEPLTLLLIFTGLWASQILWQEKKVAPAWGLLGGCSLGAAFLTRIDLPLIALIMIGLLLIRWRQGEWSKGWTVYSVSFLLFLLQAAASAWWLNRPYLLNTYSSVFRVLSHSTGIGTAVLLSGLPLGFVFVWQWPRLHTWGKQLVQHTGAHYWRGAAVIAILLLSSYAYFWRPSLNPPTVYTDWLGSQVQLLDGVNWVRLGWYLTPLGLLLATAGASLIIWRESWPRLIVFLSIGFLTTTQYIYRNFIPPYHIYMMRRYVPIIIPVLVIAIAVGLFYLWQTAPQRLNQPLTILLLLALIAGFSSRIQPLWPHQEWQGAVTQLTTLHEQLAPNAILVINDPVNSLLADTLGVPYNTFLDTR